MNTLKLTKMGMDFYGADTGATDCGNYRLRIPEIKTADGLTVAGDFNAACVLDFHNTKPGRKPRTITRFGLGIDLCYHTDTGNAYRYTPDGHGGNIQNYGSVLQSPFYGMRYTLENILTVVNTFSAVKFDRVEVIDR